jgi:hypothetical protein
METLTFYIGRDNAEILELTQNGVVVNADSVLRATFHFGSYCLDTDKHPTLIELYNDAQRLSIKAGLITGLQKGVYTGHLTIYDAYAEKGIKWQAFRVLVQPWNVCPT